MSEYVAHTETDEETGLTLRIVADSDLTQPYEDDSAVRIVVLHGRYQNPAKDSGLTSVEAVAEFEAENAADDSEWFTIPLWLYDHSGTSYRVGAGNPFSCPWDSGRVGIIALKRSEWTADDLAEAAQGVAESYTDWANGHGFAYQVTDAEGDTLDSCGGYLGDHDAEGGALEEGRAAFESAKEDARKANAATFASEVTESRPDLYA